MRRLKAEITRNAMNVFRNETLLKAIDKELSELERLADIGRQKEEADAKAKELPVMELFRGGGDKWHILNRTQGSFVYAKCDYAKYSHYVETKTGTPTCKHCLKQFDKEREQCE